ncbi:TPC6B protein, partial [Polyodon spathula]|nr:TPC6B protein [Polyodon spathula]
RMADEAVFQFLHNELIQYVYRSAEQGEMENGRCITRLENMGFRVGQGLIERFTKDTARFKDELDVMKFICKDFWTSVFKKQIDNLRTNHQGIYVLQDNKFRLLAQMSGGKQYLEHAPKYLAFSCGLVRGGLSNLGVKSIVTAEVSTMPACKCLFIYACNLLHGLFYTKIYSSYLSFHTLYTLKKGRPCRQPNLYLSIATLGVGCQVVVIDQQTLKLQDCY